MSKKTKKAMSMLLVVALIAVIAVGGMLAYLTDRDSEANVFTVGDVNIELEEVFDEQNAYLNPGSEIEKIPTIENVGPNDAWVWATVEVPAALDDYISILQQNTSDWTWMKGAEEGDVVVYTVLHNAKLDAGTVTNSLFQGVALDGKIDIDPKGQWYSVNAGVATKIDWTNASGENKDGNPTINVNAYAMQAETFDSVKDAYLAYQVQWGLGGVENGKVIDDVADLSAFLAAGGTGVVENDITSDDEVNVGAGVIAVLDLGEKTLNGTMINNGDLNVSNGTMEGTYIQNNGNATYNDVDINAGTTAHYAGISKAGAETIYNDVDITSGGGGVAAADGAKVVFNSGSVAVNSASTSGRYVFYTEGAGSEITINDGDFSFSKTLNQKRAYIYAGAGTTVYVNGGNFGPASTRSGYTAGILGTGTVIIKGGTFGFDPSAWVAEGYQAVKSGSTWTVSVK